METMRLQIRFIALALWMVCSGFVWQVRCEDEDDAQNLVRSMETAVVAIAQSASQNYDSSCGGTSGNCQAEQDCSQLQCFPSQGQSQQRDVCEYVNGSSTQCYGQAVIQCSNANADFTKSMIRLPGSPTVNFTDSGLGSLETAFGFTICAQRMLDSIFLAYSISNPESNFAFSFFFGAEDGVLRFYPGRQESLPSTCTPYDPRIRPWYNDAISVKKDVVILLDTRAAMSRKDKPWSVSSWEIAKILTKTVLQTLTPIDTFAVFTVNSTGSFPLYGPEVVVNDPIERHESFPSVLANLTLDASGNSNPSNFKAGFLQANNSGPLPNTTGDALKVVLLLTDSSDDNEPPSDLVNSTLAPLKAAGIGVFVYDLMEGDGDSTLWSNALCDLELEYESQPQNFRLQAKENPLLFLNGYFSFQARARIMANGGSMISWTKPGDSDSDPGQVVTVAYPAMSNDGTVLVGVAGVDVQTACLPPNLQIAMLSLLSSAAFSRYTTIPTIPSFKDKLSMCFKEYSRSCRGHQKSASYLPICAYKVARQSNIQFSMSLVLVLGTGVVVLFILLSMYLLLRRQFLPQRQNFSRRSIRYKTLFRCTNAFDSCNIIGQGEFGTTYRGRLGNEDVVVKRLKQRPDRAVDFQSESRVVRISSHPNLVELKGTCFREKDCFVVYEYVEGGNLESWLEIHGNLGHKQNTKFRADARFLTWSQRIQIARGVAHGLDFLHRGLPTGQILHLNLKPRNILLDANCNPRIADFGICQLYEPNHALSISSSSSSTRDGSTGYIAPEVMQIFPVPTSKLDVFSYGVVLMQLVTGRRVDDQRLRPSFLLQWVRNLFRSDDVDPGIAIDERLLESVAPESRESFMVDCRKVLKIALDCTDDRAHMRPEITTILQHLDDFQDVQEEEVQSFGNGLNNQENSVT